MLMKHVVLYSTTGEALPQEPIRVVHLPALSREVVQWTAGEAGRDGSGWWRRRVWARPAACAHIDHCRPAGHRMHRVEVPLVQAALHACRRAARHVTLALDVFVEQHGGMARRSRFAAGNALLNAGHEILGRAVRQILAAAAVGMVVDRDAGAPGVEQQRQHREHGSYSCTSFLPFVVLPRL